MFFLGISREPRFSSNREISDRDIFEAVCRRMNGSEDMLFRMTESEFARDGVTDPGMFDAVFHMCRSDRALERLAEIEASGTVVCNSPSGVLNSRRVREVELLSGSGARFATSRVVSTADMPHDWNVFPCWVKRGDSHSIQTDDVCHIADEKALSETLAQMRGRGFDSAVLQEHANGRICKFYGVGAGTLFRYRFLESVGEGRFGLEEYNELGCADVDEDAFRNEVVRIAGILGVDVFGGDAIVGEDGSVTVIDFNDWPSFFICRAAAADAIAGLVREKCSRR